MKVFKLCPEIYINVAKEIINLLLNKTVFDDKWQFVEESERVYYPSRIDERGDKYIYFVDSVKIYMTRKFSQLNLAKTIKYVANNYGIVVNIPESIGAYGFDVRGKSDQQKIRVERPTNIEWSKRYFDLFIDYDDVIECNDADRLDEPKFRIKKIIETECSTYHIDSSLLGFLESTKLVSLTNITELFDANSVKKGVVYDLKPVCDRCFVPTPIMSVVGKNPTGYLNLCRICSRNKGYKQQKLWYHRDQTGADDVPHIDYIREVLSANFEYYNFVWYTGRRAYCQSHHVIYVIPELADQIITFKGEQ